MSEAIDAREPSLTFDDPDPIEGRERDRLLTFCAVGGGRIIGATEDSLGTLAPGGFDRVECNRTGEYRRGSGVLIFARGNLLSRAASLSQAIYCPRLDASLREVSP